MQNDKLTIRKTNLELEITDTEDNSKDSAKWKRCFKNTTKVLLSHVGALFMVVLYLILGGFLFEYLELDNEKLVCKERSTRFQQKLHENIERVKAIANSGEKDDKITSELKKVMIGFSADVYKLEFEPKKNCSSIGEPGNWPKWNLYNSIFFCVTIVTTIGYGNIAPLTKWGKINTMIYSIFGIPLMLLFLTNIGELMARLFRFIYLNLCCFRCFIQRKLDQQGHTNNGAFVDDNGVPFYDQNTVVIEADNNHKNQMMAMDNLDGKDPPSKILEETMVSEEIDNNSEDDNVFVVIPITVVLLVLFIYVIIGAAMFRIWEHDWSMVDGTYFSYTTLATIGFGDLVPGKDGFEKQETAIEMLIGGVYCLLGLAILSMCLNLIQDEIAAKFRWLGNRLGIIDDNEFMEKEDIIEVIDNRTPYPAVMNENGMVTVIEHNIYPTIIQHQKMIKQTDC